MRQIMFILSLLVVAALPYDQHACAASSKNSEPVQSADSPSLMFELAFHELKENRLKAAKMGFEAGLRIEPRNALALYYYGETLRRMGDESGAATQYNASLLVDPKSIVSNSIRTALQFRDVSFLIGKWCLDAGGQTFSETISTEHGGRFKLANETIVVFGFFSKNGSTLTFRADSGPAESADEAYYNYISDDRIIETGSRHNGETYNLNYLMYRCE